MVRFGLIVIVGAIVISIIIANFYYIQFQPNFIEVNAGEPVQVGPINYIIDYLGEHKGNEKTYPNGTFFHIRIIAENTGTDSQRISGGQFYLIDKDERKIQPTYIEYSSEDLLLEELFPKKSITRTTQFDIDFDENYQYKIGIVPWKEQESTDIGIVCLTNC